MPTSQQISKPTRDTPASHQTHSLTSISVEQQARIYTHTSQSEKRIVVFEKDLEEYEFEKEANIVYNKQFKTLAKLFGDEALEFEELREKIESLILA